MSEITQITQIRDIKLNVTKEDILNVFLKEKNSYICTPAEFLKNCIIHLIMLIPALCMLIFCIINGTIPEILMTTLIAIMLSTLVVVVCYEMFDIEVLTDTYYHWKRYQYICKFVQQEFVSTEKSVKELLNLPMIYESCRTLYRLRTIANNTMDIVIKDGAVCFYDKTNNEIYLMYDINQTNIPKYCNLIVSLNIDNAMSKCDLCYRNVSFKYEFEELEMKPVLHFDEKRNDHVFPLMYTSDMLDIGICVSMFSDNTPAKMCSVINPRAKLVSLSEKWINTNIYITMHKWNEILERYPKGDVLTILQYVQANKVPY